MSEYTTTPNLGLYKPTPGEDDDVWGDHINANSDTLDTAFAGGPWLPLTGGEITAASGATALTVWARHTDTTADHAYNQFASVVDYTANATGGDNLGFISYMVVRPNGHQVMLSGHTCGIYGNAYLDNDGNAAGRCAQLNGGMFVSGNGGPGTLDRGVDVFGHANYNTGGGTITDHYFLYQEQSVGAIHEYGAYFSAPVGIGNSAPTYNLDINCGGGGAISWTNGMRIDFSDYGSLFVTRGGASIYPGYNPGKGGFGCMDLVVGFNGAANATTATGGFLYISSCAGPPTGVPAVAAIGRIAVTYDTTTHKLWVHDGTSWRGVVLT